MALSSFAFIDKIPVIGMYQSDSDDFSNKAVHPYFYRVNKSYQAQYKGILKFFNAHYWKKIIVVTDTATPLESSFYTALLEAGIEFYEIKIDGASSVTEALSLPDDKINEAVDTIKSIGTRIIYVMMTTPTVHRLFIEGIEQGFSCYHGYQWIGAGDTIDYFGYVNHLPGCTGALTCTVAYRGIFFISEALIHESYHFDRDYYAPIYRDGLYDLYTQLDPYEIRGYFITYAPTTTGRYGLFMDAILAQLKVSCWFFERNMTFDPDMLIPIVQNVSAIHVCCCCYFLACRSRLTVSVVLYDLMRTETDLVLTVSNVICYYFPFL